MFTNKIDFRLGQSKNRINPANTRKMRKKKYIYVFLIVILATFEIIYNWATYFEKIYSNVSYDIKKEKKKIAKKKNKRKNDTDIFKFKQITILRKKN